MHSSVMLSIDDKKTNLLTVLKHNKLYRYINIDIDIDIILIYQTYFITCIYLYITLYSDLQWSNSIFIVLKIITISIFCQHAHTCTSCFIPIYILHIFINTILSLFILLFKFYAYTLYLYL